MKTQHDIGYKLMADRSHGIRFKYTNSAIKIETENFKRGIAIEDLTEAQREAGNELVDIMKLGKKFISKVQLTKCVLGGYIEEDKFGQLSEMLDSGQQDTIDLGIELLAAYTFEDNPIRMIELVYSRMKIIFGSKVSMKIGFAHLMPYLNRMWDTSENYNFGDDEKINYVIVMLDALGFGNLITTEMWRDYINSTLTIEIGDLFRYEIKMETVNLTIKTDDSSYNITIQDFHSGACTE